MKIVTEKFFHIRRRRKRILILQQITTLRPIRETNDLLNKFNAVDQKMNLHKEM